MRSKFMKKYSSTGIVWGNCWGGGQSGYTTRKIYGNSLKDLRKKAETMLSDGSLDSGMGYESLIGAILCVKIEDVKTIKGKEYINTTYRELCVGKLSRKVIKLLRAHL
jgi:hypothetical protein